MFSARRLIYANMGDEGNKVVEDSVAEFIEHQNKVNMLNTKIMDDQRRKQQETNDLLKQLMEQIKAEPPRKRRILNPDVDEGESSALQKTSSQEEEAISLGIQPSEVIPDIDNDDEKNEENPWERVQDEDNLSDGLPGIVDPPEEGGNLEANSGSEFQDLLETTEEILGDPVDQKLASVIEQTWGKCLLSADRRKELWKGINIPSNCKILKTTDLNTKIQIRIHENAWKKDKAARDRQKGLSRATIPVLYGMGNMSKAKEDMAKCYKISNMEPKTLEDAKRFLAAIKKHTKEAHQLMVDTSTKLQQSVRVLAYDFTATTKKRKLDVCSALGTAFNPYSQDTKTAEEYLFNEETMKMMKNELNQIKPKNIKGKDTTTGSDSKNANYPGKSPRGGQNQGYTKKNYNSNSGNYNNSNNKNQQKSGKFNKGKRP